MKNIRKFIASGLSLFLLIFTFFPAHAIESQPETNLPVPEHFVGTPSWPLEENSETIALEVEESVAVPYLPNLNLVSITATPTRNGIVVHVSNLGVDTLDSVTVTAKISGYETTSLTAPVPPIIGKDFTWNAPMIKVEMDYDITAHIRDGSSDIQTRTGHWGLNCTEEQLNGLWHQGTWKSRQASLQYHFDKHHRDYGLNIYNIPDYIDAAVNTKWDTMDNPNDYRIVKQAANSKYVSAYKYTNKNDGRFILLTDNSSEEILAFGGA